MIDLELKNKLLEPVLMLTCDECFEKSGLTESLTMGLGHIASCDKCKKKIDPDKDGYNWNWYRREVII